MASPSQDGRLRALLEPVVREAGLELDGVRTTAAGRRRKVEVVVDLPEDQVGGVPVDAVAEASRAVSDALDASDVLGEQPYVLEVSSPGADRPLLEPRHWRRARGRLVTAVLRDGGTAAGRLVEVGDDGPVLETDGARRPLAWEAVARGRVELEFARADGYASDEPDDEQDEEV